MKYTLLLISIAFFVFNLSARAQACSPCNIDSLALSPASNYPSGGLYPSPLPQVTQGSPYDTSITYVMPKTYDTGIPGVGVVNVDEVQISSISGLPSGLQWSCNVPNCTFYPQMSQYGCVRICGTTFAPPRIYTVRITVIGKALGVSQPVNFDLDVEVVQGAVNTGSFSASGTSGCDTVTANFAALIDGTPSPTTYAWTFGNGNSSSAKTPPAQTYTTPGTYPVILETNIGNLRLTDLSLSSINENWENIPTECNDIIPILNIPQCTNTKPDLFIRVYDASSTLVYTTSEKTNENPPVSWGGISIDLTNGPYTIQIYDNDVIGEDFIGTFSLTNLTVGTHSFNGNLTNGTYTLVFVSTATYRDTVNIEVYATPPVPVVTNTTGAHSICQGDTILLASSHADTYQWSKDGIDILGATDSVVAVTLSGVYSVKVTVGQGGCIAEGFYQDTVVVNNNPAVPNVSYQAGTDRLVTNNSNNTTRQWYLDGQLIPGATDPNYSNPGPGTYQIEYTNAAGCKTMSPPFVFTSIGQVEANAKFHIYPNPTNGLLNVELNMTGSNSVGVCNLYSIVGKLVFSQPMDGAVNTLNLAELSNGVYMIEVISGGERAIQRIMVQK